MLGTRLVGARACGSWEAHLAAHRFTRKTLPFRVFSLHSNSSRCQILGEGGFEKELRFCSQQKDIKTKAVAVTSLFKFE